MEEIDLFYLEDMLVLYNMHYYIYVALIILWMT